MNTTMSRLITKTNMTPAKIVAAGITVGSALSVLSPELSFAIGNVPIRASVA